MKIWDISRTLADVLAPWPGDTPFHFKLTRQIPAGDVVNLGAITTSVHNGTHADARFHFEATGETMERAPLDIYLGPAMVVDLADQFAGGDKTLIEIDDLQPAAKSISEAPRLLIKTSVWRDSTIFPERIPVIAPEVADWLAAKGVRLLALDLPSVDAIDAKVLNNHFALARAGISIIESLDLSGVQAGAYHFAALPLKIAGADGSPVRALLWRE
jgi:arylformamidase